MKLLVVEDDAAMVAALRRGLRASYIIDVAAAGLEAVHETEAGDYDAVVLDLSLPDMPGLQVCQLICAQPPVRRCWC